MAVWVIGIVPPSSISGDAGAARLHVEEEVPFEEDPRPDLDLRVLVERAPGVVHRERDLGGVADRPGALDLADVDSRDPDR